MNKYSKVLKSSTHKIQVPYNGNWETVELPAENVLAVIEPQKISLPEKDIVDEALRRPLAAQPLEEFLSGCGKLLIIVNDARRSTPTPAILHKIYKYIRHLDYRLIVATGNHQKPDEREFSYIFDDLYANMKERIIVHNAKDDTQQEFIGRTSYSTDVYVNRLALEADRIILIGSVEPHYFAGFTGGRKGILPGIAAFKTIEQNHRLALQPGSEVLQLKKNPVHLDMKEAADLLCKPVFSIMTVIDQDRKIYSVLAGDLQKSFEQSVRKAEKIYVHKLAEKADIVVSVVNQPLDINLYQSQKAIEHSKAILKKGGIIILVSGCRQGIGDKTFYRLLSSSKDKEEILREIEEKYVLGYHKAGRIADFTRYSQIWAKTELANRILENMFIKPLISVQQGIDAALQEKGKTAKILFVMNGAMTVPRYSGSS